MKIIHTILVLKIVDLFLYLDVISLHQRFLIEMLIIGNILTTKINYQLTKTLYFVQSQMSFFGT